MRGTFRFPVLGLVAFGWAAVAFADEPKPAPKPDFTLTAEEMEKECEDKKSAIKKYKGKVVEVSGTVGGVLYTGENKKSVLQLASADAKGLGVTGSFVFDDVNLVGKYAQGQSITIRGKFDAIAIGPTVRGCEVVKAGPDTAVRVTAVQFAADYGKDRKKTEESCRDKTVVVTGTVSAVKTNADNAKIEYLELKGTDTVTVEVRYGLLDVTTLKGKFKVGDAVTFAGDVFPLRNEDILVVLINCKLAGEQPKKK